MRFFSKMASPQSFEAWKALENEDWSPTYAALAGAPKQALLKALLEEQAHVCCYCGRSIDEQDSHIEHFRPQEEFPQLALDYVNLHASCMRTPKGARSAWHCGHAKQNNFCEERFIAPTDEACERRFLYTINGEAFAADPSDLRAGYMLELLGMNATSLGGWRKAELERVFDSDFVATATAEELERIAATFRQPGRDGRCRSFGHVIARHAEQILDSIRSSPLSAAA
jgi:uncharacterized protein (TIGR02646 family)